jgi:acetyl-CoA C-acetyltransferase
MADVVLVVGHEKMLEGDSQATMTTVFDPFFQKTFSAGAPGVFTMQSMEWMYRFNIDEEKARDAAALISVSNHDNAFDNPYAHIKKRVTVDDVKNARIITYPVRLLDVCPNSDGACAVIFAGRETCLDKGFGVPRRGVFLWRERQVSLAERDRSGQAGLRHGGH